MKFGWRPPFLFEWPLMLTLQITVNEKTKKDHFISTSFLTFFISTRLAYFNVSIVGVAFNLLFTIFILKKLLYVESKKIMFMCLKISS